MLLRGSAVILTICNNKKAVHLERIACKELKEALLKCFDIFPVVERVQSDDRYRPVRSTHVTLEIACINNATQIQNCRVAGGSSSFQLFSNITNLLAGNPDNGAAWEDHSVDYGALQHSSLHDHWISADDADQPNNHSRHG